MWLGADGHPLFKMSASTTRQKLEKKEQAAAFNPTHWTEENGGSGVLAGKLQVLEKFFTPVQQTKRRKERVYLPLQMETLDDRFSIHSSCSSMSTSSALWSLEAQLEKEALPMAPSQYHSSPSGSCRESAAEGMASQTPTREKRRLGGSFTPFVRRAGDLPLRQDHPELRPQVAQAEGLEENFYKATDLQQYGPAFREEPVIPALQQPSKTVRPLLGRVVLRNGVVEEDGRLWKTRSSEAVMERPTGPKPLMAPKPKRCHHQQQEKPSSPKSLDLSLPKKSLILGENRRIEDKLRFSEFLNEVTQQIMSPSNLMSLGWKSQGSSPTNKAPSTKSMSSESLLEKNEGKTSLPKKQRVGPFEAKGDATSILPNQLQANTKPVGTTPDNTSSSSESGLFTPFLIQLPELSEEPCGARRHGEGASGHVLKPKAQEWSFKKAEEMVARGSEKSEGKEWSRTVAGKSQMLHKELLVEVNPKPSRSSQDQELLKIPVLASKSGSAQQDLQRKWEETLETLKENYSRIHEEYSNTRHTNQLLEEKLQRIVQTMAEERQAWTQRIAELERLIRFQNVFCVSEKINISDLLPKSGVQAHPGGENPMGPSSEPLLEVIPPPPPFKDRDSSIRSSSPTPADLTPESIKLGCSSEFGPARPLGDYEARGHPPPPAAKSFLHLLPLSAWKPTKFCAECVNVTEEEYGTKERGPPCPPPAPCFWYLQEASAPSSPARPLPDPELGDFPVLRPPHLSGRSAARGPPAAEWSRWAHLDAAEVSQSPGLVEKAWRPCLEHQPRPKVLDSCGLTPKCSEQEETPEKGGAWCRTHCITMQEEESGKELSSSGEMVSEGKLHPSLQHMGDLLPQVSQRGGRERRDFATIQDSTSL